MRVTPTINERPTATMNRPEAAASPSAVAQQPQTLSRRNPSLGTGRLPLDVAVGAHDERRVVRRFVDARGQDCSSEGHGNELLERRSS
jgi:hypothetical protein